MDTNTERSTRQARVTLRNVADHIGLTPGTISAVLNNTPGARRIPQSTRNRILTAARELNYQPNPLARALRTGQAMPASTDTPEFGNTRGALVIMDADHFVLAMNAIQQAGLRVPDDVSIVEFDSFPAAAMNYSGFDAAAKPS
jgi:DNA-binding LacI/PurR family transcriptional regulator